MKYFLRSFSPFCWFKNQGSCQLLPVGLSLPRKRVARLTDRLDMTIPVVDWDIKLQNNLIPICYVLPFMTLMLEVILK